MHSTGSPLFFSMLRWASQGRRTPAVSWARILSSVSFRWTAPQGQSPTGPGPGSRDFVVVSNFPVRERSSVPVPSVLVKMRVLSSVIMSPLSPGVVCAVGTSVGWYLASFTVRTTSGSLQHFVPFLKGREGRVGIEISF